MEKFNASLPLDKRMWAEDIRVRVAVGGAVWSVVGWGSVECGAVVW
jgi:hypothetical protein